VHPADVRMIWPVAGRGGPRRRHVPDILSMAAKDCWPPPHGRTSADAPARKESSRLVLPPSVCA
jgi:hypothetical protein